MNPTTHPPGNLHRSISTNIAVQLSHFWHTHKVKIIINCLHLEKQISNLSELALVNESLCAKYMYLLTKILVFLFLCENDYVDINYVFS